MSLVSGPSRMHNFEDHFEGSEQHKPLKDGMALVSVPSRMHNFEVHFEGSEQHIGRNFSLRVI